MARQHYVERVGLLCGVNNFWIEFSQFTKLKQSSLPRVLAEVFSADFFSASASRSGNKDRFHQVRDQLLHGKLSSVIALQ